MRRINRHKPVLYRFLIFSLPVLVCISCSPGPDYQRPETIADQAHAYHNAPAETAEIKAQNEKGETSRKAEKSEFDQKMTHWWRDIGHQDIRHQISLILSQNPDLKQASARIRQAREQVRINAGPLAPMISVNLSRNRNFRPAEEFSNIFGGAPGVGGTRTARIYDTSIEASAAASWQIDLFGRTRSQISGAKARFAAAELDKEALTHSLIAELVRRHITLAALFARQELAENIVENRLALLELVERRYESGVRGVDLANLHQASQGLARVRQDLPEIEQAIREQSYAIDVLLGQVPGSYAPENSSKLDLSPPVLETPIGVPAALIDRRPDLRSAEMRLIAGFEDIGVAVADLYPNVTLTGNLGYEDDTTNDLFTPDRLIGTLLSEITTTIFQGGALRARIDLEEARHDELAAAYAKDVLQAIREVETALMQEKKIVTRLKDIDDEVAASSERLKALSRRYEKGLLPLSEYLESQLDLYNARLGSILGLQAQWEARINLYLALGGDWVRKIKLSADQASGEEFKKTNHKLLREAALKGKPG